MALLREEMGITGRGGFRNLPEETRWLSLTRKLDIRCVAVPVH